MVLGIAVVAMLFAFWAALTSSGEHRTLTNISTAQKSITQEIAAEMENTNPPLYLSCAPVSAYQTGGSNAVNFTSLPSGYSAQITGQLLDRYVPVRPQSGGLRPQCAPTHQRHPHLPERRQFGRHGSGGQSDSPDPTPGGRRV